MSKSGNWKRLIPLSEDCKWNDMILAGSLENFGDDSVVELNCDQCGAHDFTQCEMFE